jgi:hypothetical protein
LAKAAKLRLSNGLEGVASTIAVDELLDVGGLDLAAVVDDFPGGIDQSLSKVEGGMVDLREAEGDIATDSKLRNSLFHSTPTSGYHEQRDECA